jgi:hypothetical protein
MIGPVIQEIIQDIIRPIMGLGILGDCLIRNGVPLNSTFFRTGDVETSAGTFGPNEPVIVGGGLIHHGQITATSPSYDISPLVRPTGLDVYDTAASAPSPDKHGLNWEKSDPKNARIFDLLSNPLIFSIPVTAGLFDFSWNGPDRLWMFPDGTTSTTERPTRTLAAGGVVLLRVDASWAGNYELKDNGTDSRYVGALSDLPPLTYWLDLRNCTQVTGPLSDLPPLTYRLDLHNCTQVTGPLSDLPPLTYWLDLYNCTQVTGPLSDLPPLTYRLDLGNCTQVTGPLSDLPPLTYWLDLRNCTQVTGPLSDLPPLTYWLDLHNCTQVTGPLSDLPPLTYWLDLHNCTQVTGIIPPTMRAYRIYIYGTGLSQADLEQSLINVDSVAAATAPSGATFDAALGMPTITDPEAIAAVDSLRSKGWTVNVNGA